MGRLVLIDSASVDVADLSSSLFQHRHIGLPRAVAAAAQLQDVLLDSGTQVTPLELDLAHGTGAHALQQALQEQPVDLLLCCTGSATRRSSVNDACLSRHQVWVDAALAHNAMSGAALC